MFDSIASAADAPGKRPAIAGAESCEVSDARATGAHVSDLIDDEHRATQARL